MSDRATATAPAPATGRTTSVAVIGMAGRFPGADGIPRFWHNLTEGKEAVRAFTTDEMRAAGVRPEQLADPGRVTAGGLLDDADLFDAGFFRTTPRDAALMDPQHRVFLTCAWEAMEDAGIPTGAEHTGVFASCSINTYLLSQLLRSARFTDEALAHQILLGSDKDFLATRVAYKFGLTGPAMTVQTACSSSLVAVHQACAALGSGECDTALAGGVSITVPQTAGYPYQEGGILSRDGHCRVFDAASDGTVKGNGCGVVVLKPLERARADGDRVYAVIRGTAINNDGSEKIGYTAPGPVGQEAVIRAALTASGVPAEHIGYVETHGTGTALGDPLELGALAAAHRSAGGPEPGCALGSAKAAVGHLDAAAGITGLIKATLVLHHQTVPPQVNFRRPNPRLRLETLPYTVPTHRTARTTTPLRAAAVSSFGIGGTNAHCVLTPAPPAPAVPVPRPGTRYPVVLSARDDQALAAIATRLRDHLSTAPDIGVRDVAYTLAVGRTAMSKRYAFTATDRHEVLAGLDAFPQAPGPVPPGGDCLADAFVTEWLAGGKPRWAFGPARKVSLPTYPFRPARHWIEADLNQRATPTEPAAGTAVPAAAPAVVLEQVLSVLEKHLGTSGITPDEDYFDLGGDSMTAVEIAASLTRLYGLSVNPDTIADHRTARGMAEHIGSRAVADAPQRAGAGKTTVIRPGAGRALFLVHPAGGNNFIYYRLAQASRGLHPIHAVTFPADPAQRPGTLRELAALYVGQIRARQPHGPYRLGGYSFGGNVAFEMALQLHRAGQQVDPLLLIDSYPPEAYIGGRTSSDDLERAVPLLMRATERAVNHTQAELLRRNGFITTWQHNIDLLKGYYPDSRFPGGITLLQAKEDDDSALLETLHVRRLDKSRWKEHIEGELRVHHVLGGHYSVFEEGDRLRALAAAFDQALPGSRPAPDDRR